jgi:hypothetical protein
MQGEDLLGTPRRGSWLEPLLVPAALPLPPTSPWGRVPSPGTAAVTPLRVPATPGRTQEITQNPSAGFYVPHERVRHRRCFLSVIYTLSAHRKKKDGPFPNFHVAHPGRVSMLTHDAGQCRVMFALTGTPPSSLQLCAEVSGATGVTHQPAETGPADTKGRRAFSFPERRSVVTGARFG